MSGFPDVPRDSTSGSAGGNLEAVLQQHLKTDSQLRILLLGAKPALSWLAGVTNGWALSLSVCLNGPHGSTAGRPSIRLQPKRTHNGRLVPDVMQRIRLSTCKCCQRTKADQGRMLCFQRLDNSGFRKGEIGSGSRSPVPAVEHPVSDE